MEGAETDAESVERTKVAQVFDAVGEKMLFLFDYGDDWRFQVELLAIGEKAKKTSYPKLIARLGEAPPQYPDFDDEE